MSVAASYHTRYMREYSKRDVWKEYRSRYDKLNQEKVSERQRRFREKNRPYIKFKKDFKPSSLTVTQIRVLCEKGLAQVAAQSCSERMEALGVLLQIRADSALSSA
jgi:hypothetical protein